MIPTPQGTGLVVSPGFVPRAGDLDRLRPAFLRSILYRLSDLDPLLDTGLPILPTINNQLTEMGGWSHPEAVAHELVRRGKGRIFATNWGNEFDLYWQHNEADVPPEFAAELVHRVAPILHDGGIAVIPTSVASERWPEYLSRLAPLCRDVVDYFDIHPYGQRPPGWGRRPWMHGELVELLRRASAITGRRVISSEYGVKLVDAGGPEAVAAFLKAADAAYRSLSPDVCGGFMSWFAFHDHVGAPHEQGDQAFGLVSADDEDRPAYHTFARLPKFAPTEVPTVPNLDAWRGRVGSGLLEMMAADGTEPAMASEWRPFGRPETFPGSGVLVDATIEQAIGMNGTTYIWHLPTNQSWRQRAS